MVLWHSCSPAAGGTPVLTFVLRRVGFSFVVAVGQAYSATSTGFMSPNDSKAVAHFMVGFVAEADNKYKTVGRGASWPYPFSAEEHHFASSSVRERLVVRG